MKNICNLEDLLKYELQNLYAAEQYVFHALENIIKFTNNGALQKALQHELEVTTIQQQRLPNITNAAKLKVQLDNTALAKGMKELVDEAYTLLQNVSNDVIDSAVIASVQKIKHYEICSYGIALAYAKQLHYTKAAEMLQESLDEEYDADELLTQLATNVFNKKAAAQHAGDKPVNIDTETMEGYRPDHKPKGHSTKDIRTPGGRAGRSHRSYPDGTSRGH